MKRNAPCTHMQPAYDRMDDAAYIIRDPETDEISWPPSRMADELIRLGLIDKKLDPDT